MRRLSLTLNNLFVSRGFLNHLFRLWRRVVAFSLSQISWSSSSCIIMEVSNHRRLGVSDTACLMSSRRYSSRSLRVNGKGSFKPILAVVVWIPRNSLVSLGRVRSACHCATSVLVLLVLLPSVASLWIRSRRRLCVSNRSRTVDKTLNYTVLLLVLFSFDELLLVFSVNVGGSFRLLSLICVWIYTFI